MDKCWHPFVMLWLTTAGVTLGVNLEADESVRNFIDKTLRVIPYNENNSTVTKLTIEGGQITLSETDRLALATYPALVELHLNGNLVTSLPAKYLSVVPHLTVLSLSNNNISSLDPESFFGLEVLTVLDLSHNRLTNLHISLLRGLHLQMLNLMENPWNCSCSLLSTIEKLKETGVDIGGPRVICATPERQAGHDLLELKEMCPTPPPPPTFTTELQKSTLINSQQSSSSPTVLKTALTSNQNHNISNAQTPALGHTWKFTACVMALGLCTAMLILCAIKGPSWYKLFHNYRHKQLTEAEDEDEDVVSSVFSERGRYLSNQTFTFQQGNRQTVGEDEEEDGYYEDPYIRREE